MKYALFCLLLSGCLFSQDKSSQDDAIASYFRYGIVGDSTAGNAKYLLMYSDFQQAHCEGNKLVKDPPGRMAQLYSLHGDSLDFWFMINPEDSSNNIHDVYIRTKPAASLAGHWRRVHSRSENPNHSEVPDYMKSDLERRDSAYRNESMVITSDSVLLSYERTPESRIWDLIANLPNTITYKFYGQERTVFSKAGGDQVTFQAEPSGNMKVSSSKHPDLPYLLFEIPTQCPIEDTAPQWYSEFFELPMDGDPLLKRSSINLRRD